MKPMRHLRKAAARPAPALLTVASALLAASAFFTAPAQAQVPTALPTNVLWSEEFEDDGSVQHRPVAADHGSYAAGDWYTGALGEWYTADADWLPAGTMAGAASRCNGWVVNNSEQAYPPSDATCNAGGGRYVVLGGNYSTNIAGPSAWGYLRRMAYAMGLAQGKPDAAPPGPDDAKLNNAVASLTNGAAPNATQPNSTQLRLDSIPTPAGTPYQTVKGNFYVASVMFAAVHCSVDMEISGPVGGLATGWSDPVENVNLLVDGLPVDPSGNPILSGVPILKTPADYASGRGNVCPTASGGKTAARAYTAPSDAPTTDVPGFYPYQDTSNTPNSVTNPAAGNVFIVRRHSEPYRAKQAGQTLGLRLDNTQTSGSANDVAFDQLRITDATPFLYKSFHQTAPQTYRDGSIARGSTGTLTFIIVNTEDNLAKGDAVNGYLSFTDVLPDNVKVADPLVKSSTCKSSDDVEPAVAVSAGGSTIEVTNIGIADDVGTCTISVQVTSDVNGEYLNYVNGTNPLTPGKGGVPQMDGLRPLTAESATLFVDDILLDKTAAVTDSLGNPKPNVTKAGDKIIYTFTLTNAGTDNEEVLDLTTLKWYDPEPPQSGLGFSGHGPWDPSASTCTIEGPGTHTPGELAVGQTYVCKMTYDVILEDIDKAVENPDPISGPSLINVATITVDAHPENEPWNVVTLTSPKGTAIVLVNPEYGLVITKVPDKKVLPAAGTNVVYNIEITNNGTTTLSDVALSDIFYRNGTAIVPAPAPGVVCKDSASAVVPLPIATLVPAATITCTVTYTVVPADVTAGDLENRASATGKKPGDTTPTVTSTPVSADLKAPAINVAFSKTIASIKSSTGATQSTVMAAGDVITYSFTLTNNGLATDVINTGLNGGNLTWADANNDPSATPNADGFTGVNALPINCTGMPATLTANQSFTCKATYTVQQTDIDNAVAYYTPPKIQNLNAAVTMNVYSTIDPAVVVSRTLKDSRDVTVTEKKELTIGKKESANQATLPGVGATVAYTITFTNNSNETLFGVKLDDVFSGSGAPLAITCLKGATAMNLFDGSATMAPGDTIVCTTGNYVVTAADVAAGNLLNKASVTSENLKRVAVNSSVATALLVKAGTGAAAIPALDARGLALLALMLGALAWRTRRARQR